MANTQFNGKFQILARSATGSADFNVIGFFNDEISLYSSTDVKINDRVIDLGGNIYRIAAINSNASLMNLDIEDLEGSGLPNVGGGIIERPTGCTLINVPAAGISKDLSTILIHDAYINIGANLCDINYCQYEANVFEVTGATFEGITIENVYYEYSGSTIYLYDPLADEKIETYLNSLNQGVFNIDDFNIATSGTTYTVFSYNNNVVNTITHDDGTPSSTIFNETCGATGEGFTIRGVYDNFEDALADGVLFNQFFQLSANNPYGSVEGTIVRQILT